MVTLCYGALLPVFLSANTTPNPNKSLKNNMLMICTINGMQVIALDGEDTDTQTPACPVCIINALAVSIADNPPFQPLIVPLIFEPVDPDDDLRNHYYILTFTTQRSRAPPFIV